MLLTLFLRLVLLSMLAFGGAQSMLTEMYRVVVNVEHWMTAQDFADYFAIAQASPGPNMLIVTLVGWHVGQWQGALVATVAATVPSSILALIAYKKIYNHKNLSVKRWVQYVSAPISVGLVVASSANIAITLSQSWRMLAVSAATILLVQNTRVHPLTLIFLGGLLGTAGLF
jgi:chromate transporter